MSLWTLSYAGGLHFVGNICGQYAAMPTPVAAEIVVADL